MQISPGDDLVALATRRPCNCDIGLFQPVGDVIVRRGGERDGWSAKTRADQRLKGRAPPREIGRFDLRG